MDKGKKVKSTGRKTEGSITSSYKMDEVMRVLYQEEGIQGILHYQPSYHFTGLKKMRIYKENECPVAEKFFYK